VRGAVADHHDLGAGGADLVPAVAQLRDLLAAEQSAEVADEHEHDRALAPQIAQPNRALVCVAELDSGERGIDVGHPL
jgi:hypothetical protein